MRRNRNRDSGGIWAPCLSHADSKFRPVFAEVKRRDGACKDTHNHIITCDTLHGD